MKKLSVLILAACISIGATAQLYKGTSQEKTLQDKLNEEYCTGMFKTTDGVVFDIASENSTAGYLNILDWLEFRVAGLQVYKSRTGISVPVIRGNVTNVYVNEIPVSLSYLNAISMADIAMIKVIKTAFLGGFNGAGGAIAIYTYKGEDDEEEDSSK